MCRKEYKIKRSEASTKLLLILCRCVFCEKTDGIFDAKVGLMEYLQTDIANKFGFMGSNKNAPRSLNSVSYCLAYGMHFISVIE